MSMTTSPPSLLCSLLLLGCALPWGCSSELDPTQPEDAYLMFRNALWEGKGDEAWKLTDEQTKAFFEQNYLDLVAMEGTIDRYLPQADHRIAKRQSGAVLLREVTGGHDLFLKVFTPKNLQKTEGHRVGSEVDEVLVAEDEKSAQVITMAKQSFYMSRPTKEDAWSLELLKSAPVGQKMGWVSQNKTALGQTVDDLIAEERVKREAVIAELMGPELAGAK